MSPDQVEQEWAARARKVRRRNIWRAVRAFVLWSLLALVLFGLGMVLFLASTIEVVI